MTTHDGMGHDHHEQAEKPGSVPDPHVYHQEPALTPEHDRHQSAQASSAHQHMAHAAQNRPPVQETREGTHVPAHGEHDHHTMHMAHGSASDHAGHIDHTGHELLFCNRFWACLVLSVPVLLYSPLCCKCGWVLPCRSFRAVHGLGRCLPSSSLAMAVCHFCRWPCRKFAVASLE